MKILFVCTATGKGTFLSLSDKDRYSAKHTKSKAIPFVESQYKSLVELDISVDLFTIDKSGIIGYISSYRKLRKTLAKNNYDIIHSHFVYTGLLSLLSKFRNQRLLISFMGSDVFGYHNQAGKQTIVGNFTKLCSKILAIFSDKIIVKTKEMKSYIPHSRREVTTVLPNGVNFNLFRPIDREICKNILGLESKKKYILFLGNPKNHRKGFNLITKAYEKMDKNKYEILAPYPQQHKYLKYFYNASSVLVTLSKMEGSQNVIKEALACNLPVVGTDSGDARERLEPLQGCFITDGKPEDLSNKIILACKSNNNYRDKIEDIKLSNIAKRLSLIYSDMVC